jgi:hypothetical protein
MKALVLFIIVAFVLSGCSAFFEFNAFEGLSTPPAPTAAEYQAVGGLAKLQQDLTSAAIVNALKNDPITTKAIEDYLLSQMGAMTTNDQKTAAILYGDVYLKTTEGEALVNNIVSILAGSLGGSSTYTPPSIPELLKSVLPPAALADKNVFTPMVAALLNACGPYLALGGSITDLNLNGKIDPGEGVPPGTNMGDVAQKAAVAWTVKVIYVDVDTALGGPGLPQSQVIDELYLQATGAPTVTISSPTNPYSPVNSNLKNLFDCAGIPMPT